MILTLLWKFRDQVLGYGTVYLLVKAVLPETRTLRSVCCKLLRSTALLAFAFSYGTMRSGPMTPVLYTLFGVFRPRITIHGSVAPGYEHVREVFTQRF